MTSQFLREFENEAGLSREEMTVLSIADVRSYADVGAKQESG